MSYAYATANVCTGLAASAFTPTGGAADATRSYLNDGRMDKPYSFNATASTVSLVVDFGSSIYVQGVALLNSNIATAVSPTILVELATNAAISTGVYTLKSATSPATTAPNNKDHVLQGATDGISRRYMRVTWAWTGTFTLTLGELFVYAVSPTLLSRGSVYGSGESEEFFDVVNEMMYGDTRAYLLGGPIRRKLLRFADFTATDKAEHRTLWAAVRGRVSPFLWVESYEASTAAAATAQQECMYGRLWVPQWSWTQDDYGVYAPRELELRSLGREVGA